MSEWHEALRKPFPESAVGKLPRGNTQLDYVGHAAVTDRLLAVDPTWTWEPMGVSEAGLPLFLVDDKGQPSALWIRLTVKGVTRIGVGTLAGSRGLDPYKELISDAIRNAAMRFGVALDLWSKEELESAPKATKPRGNHPAGTKRPASMSHQRMVNECREALSAKYGNAGAIQGKLRAWFPETYSSNINDLSEDELNEVIERLMLDDPDSYVRREG